MPNRSTLLFRLAIGTLSPLCVALGFNNVAHAQVVVAPPPTVGSSNPVSAEPLVTRPSTTPCKVQLFLNQAFTTSANVAYTFTPPAACPGPWAKVVFTADFTVAAGQQIDRNAAIYLGNATLFRGTTAEPHGTLSPSWHVESDATDFSALFAATQSGVATVSNALTATETSTIYANAELDFYPTSPAVPAAVVPDLVVPIVSSATNPNQSFTTASPLTLSVTLPKNMTQLYLDVIAQPDELWWLATPNAQAAPYIDNVDATALRELDVTIDGKPAGIAPNHPYIFTGGLDPFLWEPIPGAQTLNLKPYRINLTPFAGALSDGNPHTLVIDDINTLGSAYINADLFVYTDHGGATTTGEVTTNTLTVNPGTGIGASINLDANGNGTAQIDESLKRSFTITGFVNTSAGKFATTVAETVAFSNAQQLTNQNTPLQNVILDNLTSTVDSTVTTVTPKNSTMATYHTENPLQVFITYDQNTNGTYTRTTTATVGDVNNQLGPGTFSSTASETVMATDSLTLDASRNVTGNSNATSTGTASLTDSLGDQYSNTLTSAANVLTGVTVTSTSTGSTLFVTASPTTIAQGSTVTLTATVMPNNSMLVPTGRITFYANGNALSVLPLSGGTISVGINFLHAGANLITATYDGDANFLPESSINPVTVNVTAVAGSFTVGPATPATVSVSPGASAIVSVPVTSGSTFMGTVALACTGAPTNSTCVVNPPSVALVPSTGSVISTQTLSVVVTTTANTVAAVHAPSFGFPMAAPLGGITVASLCLLMLPRRRGNALKPYNWKSRTLPLLLFCGLGIAALTALSGCGSGSTNQTAPSGGTPAGTYTITVTGTSGAITQSTTFALTVN